MGLRMVATLAVVMLIGCGDAVDQPDDQAISTTVTTLEETPGDTAGTTPQVSDTIMSTPTGTGPPASEAPTELRAGDQGPQVEALQRQLVRLGFTIDADGHFGPATRLRSGPTSPRMASRSMESSVPTPRGSSMQPARARR